jgi:hypothetical protein
MGHLSNELGPGSAVELTALLQNELSRLSMEDLAITQVIRSFSLLLQDLKRAASGKLPRHLSAEWHFSNDFGQPIREAGKDGLTAKRGRPRGASLRDQGLRRACRIALMETDEPAGAEEIYSRILRRESFIFNSSDGAVAAIARALEAMAGDGETSILKNCLPLRWKRATTEKEVRAQQGSAGSRLYSSPISS